MDEGMMQGGAPRSMRSPGFAARGFLRHEAEFPGSQTSLAADAPAITFQRSKSISNLEVFDRRQGSANRKACTATCRLKEAASKSPA